MHLPRFICFLAFFLIGSHPVVSQSQVGGESSNFRKIAADLWVWTDTCNVYVLRDGDAALLIDLGDGGVLDHLGSVGIKEVEWVVFTHHHREQCQGASRLKGSRTKFAAPAAERSLFEKPASFRRMKVRLGDPFTVYGASYVRPPIEPIPLDQSLTNGASFKWRGYELSCISTPGNSPGAMSYLITKEGRRLCFNGDVMLKGARMHTWFDTEWDYGFAAGIQTLRKSVETLRQQNPDWLLPAHGAVVHEAASELSEYAGKLERLEKLYVRGYGVEAASNAYQDKVSTPTIVSNINQVSPHLFKFKRVNFWPNFNLILADSGRALLVDCGLLDEAFLEEALQGMKQHFGLRNIDAVIVTHMHGDHFLEAPYLKSKWGTQIWGLDRMAPVCEKPKWFDYACPIQSYDKKGVERIQFDRLFKPGETFEWEGSKFTVDWMPGQTEFALCLNGQIDGRKVAFTGDNIFGDPEDPTQTGHEAMVAHNSAVLEEGYIYAGEYLKKLQPDILVGGHSFVMDRPQAFIERYRLWAYEMRAAFQELSSETDYRYWFDPFWVRAEPYRMTVRPGEEVKFQLHVRNFHAQDQVHRIVVCAPAGVTAETKVVEGKLGAEERRSFPVILRAAADARPGTRMAAFDITLDGKRYGQFFDVIVTVE